jgi:hypothetical protein
MRTAAPGASRGYPYAGIAYANSAAMADRIRWTRWHQQPIPTLD